MRSDRRLGWHLVVGCAIAFALVRMLPAKELTFKSGSTDWSKAASYAENQTPELGDTVKIPNGVAAVVSDANADSYAAFAGLSLVKMGGKTASLEINVAEGAVRTNACRVYYSDATFDFRGKVIKSGAGETVFTNWWNNVLVVDIHVQAGTLVSPQNYNKSGQHLHAGNIEVDEGATFVLPGQAPEYQSSGANGNAYLQSLSGGGSVVCRDTRGTICYVQGGAETTFSGWIGPGIRLRPGDGTILNLTGLANEFSAEMAGDGTLSGLSFGKADSSSSSLGKGMIDFVSNGTIRYSGAEPEETDRPIQLRGTTSGPAWMDAGTNGELTLTGKVQMQNSYKNMQRFGLSGDNEKPAVFAGNFVNSAQNGTNYTYHVSKDGTGTWLMKANAANQWSGALSVLNGTLQFDSLADAGTQCALGFATQLYDDYYGSVDPAHKVDWAWKLGATETCGTLEYAGEGGAWTTNRAAVVTGAGGGFSNASASELGLFGGVTPLGTENVTVTLGGTTGAYNVIGNLTDGEGKLSLTKVGPNAWVLDAGNTFSGDLEVREGTLYVRDTTKYSWFKWVFTERKSGKSEDETLYGCEELGLYDSDNVRINANLRPYSNYFQKAENRLPPGYCGFFNPGVISDVRSGVRYPIEAMFDDGASMTDDCASFAYLRRAAEEGGTTEVVVDPNDPDTWTSVNMHLPFGAKPAKAFDFSQIAYGWNYQRAVMSFKLLGSVDGRTWDPLLSKTLTVSTSNTTTKKWASSGAAYTVGSAETHAGGFSIASGPANPVAALANVGCVSVGAGARLVAENASVCLAKLSVDGRGAGTIENCSFAANGTIEVVNHKGAQGGVLGLEFVNCVSPERIANWTAVVDGKTNCKIDYRNGKLYVVRPGLLIVVQ